MNPADTLGEAFGRTTIHPVGLTFVLLLGLLMIVVPRRLALLPMIVLACCASTAQRVVVADLDFDFLRIMILFGWLRLLVRGELRGFGWNRIDTAMTLFVVTGTIAYMITNPDEAAVKWRLSWAFVGAGTYFLFRFLLRGGVDVREVGRMFTWVAVPSAVLFLIESTTGRNVFHVFGGVPEFTVMRDGRLRCQGPFPHPIIAGVFWVSILPVTLALWWEGARWRRLAVAGTASILLIVFTTSSSTPVSSVGVALLATAMYRWRRTFGQIRTVFVVFLVLLHLLMKAPVWHLIARVTVFDASTGWHRCNLIDQSLAHFSEWWLVGTKSTAHWGRGLTDVTNEFVLVGVRGGAASLLAFLAMIWFCFKAVGVRVAASERLRIPSRMQWALGAMLFVHCMNFIAVSYFGQSIMIFFFGIALLAQGHRVAGARPAAPAAVPARAGRSLRAIRPGGAAG